MKQTFFLQKRSLVIAAAVSGVILVGICLISLLLMGLNRLDLHGGVSLIHLLVEIVGLGLILWGLYWLICELGDVAVHPEVHVFLAQGNRDLPEPAAGMDQNAQEAPVSHQKIALRGTRTDGAAQLAVGIYLQNLQPRAGRFPYLRLKISAAPLPGEAKFSFQSDVKPENSLRSVVGEMGSTEREIEIASRLRESLIVYQAPLFVGDLTLRWESLSRAEQLPQKVKVAYEVHTLDGSSKGLIEARMVWKA